MLKLSHIWPVGVLPLQSGSCVLLTCPYHPLGTYYVPGTRCSKQTLSLLCPSPEISYISKEPGSFESRMVSLEERLLILM